MEIHLKVKSLEIVGDANAVEAVIEFNDRLFDANLFPKGLHSDTFEFEIQGIDIKNLERAGFTLDLSELQEKYNDALIQHRMKKQKASKEYREKVFSNTRLHELKEFLEPYFSMMTMIEFLNSKSGALYAYYKYPYRDFTKELSIFMDRENFVVYDSLNEETITDYSSDPAKVKQVIDEHINAWKHKVDFKLALMKDVKESEKGKDPTQTVSATEYFKKLQEQDQVHENEIRKNHWKYLQMLGKLGDNQEIQDHVDQHSGIEETDSIDKKRLLGSLTDTKKIKIRHMFEDK